MDLYSENHELKDAKLSDVARLCANGDISYESACKWCQENDISEYTFDRWLYLALRTYPNVDSMEQLVMNTPEPDIPHRIMGCLRHIFGWLQTRLEN